jgi:hypothetical protein
MSELDEVAEVHAQLTELLSQQIQAILFGKPRLVQSAVLADLLAIWIAGHEPAVRDEVLMIHLTLVQSLIGPSEQEMFGPAGHPGSVRQ